MKFKIHINGIEEIVVGLVFILVGVFSISSRIYYTFDSVVIYGIGILFIWLGICFVGITVSKK